MLLLFAAFGMPQKLCTNRCRHFTNLCYGPWLSVRLTDWLTDWLGQQSPFVCLVWDWDWTGLRLFFGKQLKTCFNQSHLANNFLNALANAMATIYGDCKWKFKIHVSKINNRRMATTKFPSLVCECVSVNVSVCIWVCINTICPLSTNNWMQWLLPNWFWTAPRADDNERASNNNCKWQTQIQMQAKALPSL